MSRRAINVFIGVYFLVALAISILWTLATPGIADMRPAAIIGGMAGRALGLMVLPGLLPLIYWAARRFRAESADSVLAIWAMLGVIFLMPIAPVILMAEQTS